MRLLVMFDLPTKTAYERHAHAKFRKFLLDDGYDMEQLSIYSRVTLGKENTQTHIERIRKNLPQTG